MTKILAVLGSRRSPWVFAARALALGVPSIGNGLPSTTISTERRF